VKFPPAFISLKIVTSLRLQFHYVLLPSSNPIDTTFEASTFFVCAVTDKVENTTVNANAIVFKFSFVLIV
jgi:hypothetical protein